MIRAKVAERLAFLGVVVTYIGTDESAAPDAVARTLVVPARGNLEVVRGTRVAPHADGTG